MTTTTQSNSGEPVYTGSGTPTEGEEVVLSFSDVDVRFKTEFGSVHAVKGVDLRVRPGEVVALVGESGSGKSVTSMTAMRLLPRNATIGGQVDVAGHAGKVLHQDPGGPELDFSVGLTILQPLHHGIDMASVHGGVVLVSQQVLHQHLE